MAKTRPHDRGVDTARKEAIRLLADIREDIEDLAAFVAAEEASIERRAPGPKRVARLRLIAQDLASANAFARRSDKV